MSAASALMLPGRIDATTLGGVLAALKDRRGDDLDIDASMVDRIGGQGLQLVLSAFRTWREDGHRLRIVDPSPNFLAAVDRLGLPHASPDGTQGLT